MQRSIEINYKQVAFSPWPRGDLLRFDMAHMRVGRRLSVAAAVAQLARILQAPRLQVELVIGVD